MHEEQTLVFGCEKKFTLHILEIYHPELHSQLPTAWFYQKLDFLLIIKIFSGFQ